MFAKFRLAHIAAATAVIKAVVQIREGSQVKNPTRLATLSVKLIENFR